MVGLDAVDQRAGHRPCKQRILAGIFEVAAVTRFAREVHAARQHRVVAGGSCFRADHCAARSRDLGVEACRRGKRGGQGSARNEAVANADRSIGLGLVGNAEARDARDEPRRTFDLVRNHVDLEIGRDDVVRHLGEIGQRLVRVAEDEPQLLVEGHRGKRGLGARFRRKRRVEPGLCRRGEARAALRRTLHAQQRRDADAAAIALLMKHSPQRP